MFLLVQRHLSDQFDAAASLFDLLTGAAGDTMDTHLQGGLQLTTAHDGDRVFRIAQQARLGQ